MPTKSYFSLFKTFFKSFKWIPGIGRNRDGDQFYVFIYLGSQVTKFREVGNIGVFGRLKYLMGLYKRDALEVTHGCLSLESIPRTREN